MSTLQPGDLVLVGESKHVYRVVAVFDGEPTVTRADGTPGHIYPPADWCRRLPVTAVEAAWIARKDNA